MAVLIDPDKYSDLNELDALLKKTAFANIDYLFVGGSTVLREDFKTVIDYIQSHSSLPLVIFPGDSNQISEKADALLYLSLISGRNPDYLIGHHVQSAQEVYAMDVEVIPTAYILVDGGNLSSVAYVSQTTPIPRDHESIILNTAKAGVLQGKKLIYLDAGSGAKESIPPSVIQTLSPLGNPIVVGGGIRSLEEMEELRTAGANVIVIGNKLEEDLDFLLDIKEFKVSK
ncbi:MAG: geranylgeranylglyceryl/heptaprenylglyceryl phosphate synthase [Crocinitomicaceae bacterium]|nr:geranylgeranylglyceryl/heptaprenylglyceryl phosphate synthase [Crocinitomicaceae bacterium]